MKETIFQQLEAALLNRLAKAKAGQEPEPEPAAERVVERVVVRDVDIGAMAKALVDLLHWERIAGKPEEYPPVAHRHEDTDQAIGALRKAVNALRNRFVAWGDIQGKPNEYPPTAHQHAEIARVDHLLYEGGSAGQVLTQTVSGKPEWKRVATTGNVYYSGGGGPVFPAFVGNVPAGHFAVVAGDVTVTSDMAIEGVLVCH